MLHCQLLEGTYIAYWCGKKPSTSRYAGECIHLRAHEELQKESSCLVWIMEFIRQSYSNEPHSMFNDSF